MRIKHKADWADAGSTSLALMRGLWDWIIPSIRFSRVILFLICEVEAF